jgi:hypothetical protein
MKKFILMFLLLSIGLCLAQAPDVRVLPYQRDGEWVLGTKPTGILEDATNGLLIGVLTGQYSTAVSTFGYDGAVTLWFLMDTTGASVKAANQSDSCMTVWLQLKNKELNVWGGYYSETTSGYTVLDTIDRAYINVAGTVCPYMILAEETSWAAADSARFGFVIGVGDSLNGQIVLEGF